MDWVNIAFWVFAIAATVSAGAVISVRNPVHAVLCLVLTFFSIACVWLLVGAEFIAMLLVIVYVGAVSVLFLFVVMMLDIRIDAVRQGFGGIQFETIQRMFSAVPGPVLAGLFEEFQSLLNLASTKPKKSRAKD